MKISVVLSFSIVLALNTGAQTEAFKWLGGGGQGQAGEWLSGLKSKLPWPWRSNQVVPQPLPSQNEHIGGGSVGGSQVGAGGDGSDVESVIVSPGRRNSFNHGSPSGNGRSNSFNHGSGNGLQSNSFNHGLPIGNGRPGSPMKTQLQRPGSGRLPGTTGIGAQPQRPSSPMAMSPNHDQSLGNTAAGGPRVTIGKKRPSPRPMGQLYKPGDNYYTNKKRPFGLLRKPNDGYENNSGPYTNTNYAAKKGQTGISNLPPGKG